MNEESAVRGVDRPMLARRVPRSGGDSVASLLVKENLFGPSIGLLCDDASQMASFCGKQGIVILRLEVCSVNHTSEEIV